MEKKEKIKIDVFNFIKKEFILILNSFFIILILIFLIFCNIFNYKNYTYDNIFSIITTELITTKPKVNKVNDEYFYYLPKGYKKYDDNIYVSPHNFYVEIIFNKLDINKFNDYSINENEEILFEKNIKNEQNEIIFKMKIWEQEKDKLEIMIINDEKQAIVANTDKKNIKQTAEDIAKIMNSITKKN